MMIMYCFDDFDDGGGDSDYSDCGGGSSGAVGYQMISDNHDVMNCEWSYHVPELDEGQTSESMVSLKKNPATHGHLDVHTFG